MIIEAIENLEGEIWIENNGYKVSNKGRIIGKQGKLLNCKPNKDGYLQCSITFDDGFHAGSVHRAVGYAFIPNPNNYEDINHKDGIKTHNYDSNLEWVTHKENMQHRSDVLGCMVGTDNPTNKLTDEQVIEIYNLCKTTDMRYKDIAESYNIVPSQVSLIVGGYKWKYLKLEPLPRLVRGSRRNGRTGCYT